MQRTRCLYLTGTAFLCVAAVFFSCTKKDKIPVALMTKLESGSIVGSSEVNAAKFFLEEHKSSRIDIFPIDDKWSPADALAAYKSIRKKGINILVTSHVSTCAVEIMDQINQDRVFTLVTGATTDLLSKKDDYIFRVIPDVEEEQKRIAEYIGKLPGSNLLVIRDLDNDAYTTPAFTYFKKFCRKKTIHLIDIRVSRMDMTDLSAKMKKTGFDILYLLVGGYKSHIGGIAQMAVVINPSCRIVFTPWMKSPNLVETAGGALKNAVMPSHYPAREANSAVDAYIDKFRKRYGHAPTFISLNVYGALEVLNDAFEAGFVTPDEIRAYMLRKKTFKTSFGEIRFNSCGDVHSELYFVTDVAREFR